MRFHTTLLLVFLLTVTNLFAQKLDVDKLFYQAVYAEQIDGDLEKARSLYQQIIKANPDDRTIMAKTLFRLGLITEKNGSKQALGYYTQVVEKYPEQKDLIELVQARVEKLEDANTFIDERDRHKYKYVQIGKQIWMAENLAYMPHVNPVNKQEYGIWVYDYDGSDVAEAKTTENYQKYGCLYDWPTAMGLGPEFLENSWKGDSENHQGLCPPGWRMPSDKDWIELERFLGMPDSLLYIEGIRAGSGENFLGLSYSYPAIGSSLKSKFGWMSDGNGNNSSGFNAFAAGSRIIFSARTPALNGYGFRNGAKFNGLGEGATFYSSTEFFEEYKGEIQYEAVGRYLYNNPSGAIDRDSWMGRSNGYSIRCLKNHDNQKAIDYWSEPIPQFKITDDKKNVNSRFYVAKQTDSILQSSNLYRSHNWSKFGRDLHNTGFVNSKITQSTPKSIKKHLRGKNIFFSLVVDDTIYSRGLDSILYATDITSGKLIWQFKAEALINSNPVVSDGHIIFGSGDKGERRDSSKIYGDKYLYCLKTSTGKEIWKIEKGNGTSWNPVIHNKIIYVGNGKNFIAIDINTGQEKWKYTLQDKMGQVNSGPAIYMNQIIFSAAKKIVSLNMEDGSLLWEYQTGGFAFSSPAISHGMFFFADDDHYFYAVDIKTLQKVWRFYLDAKFNWGSPGIAYNSVYFGSFDGSFYCIDINEGEQNWKYYHKGESWSNQHPAIADGSVVIGLADANIISLDASTGEIKWKYSAANVSFSNPIIYKGKIIVSASDGLYILE